MTGRRAIIGLSLLCAFALSAFAAQGASAGTTAFTCAKGQGGVGFSDEHCTKAVQTGATFEHVAIAVDKETKYEATNEKTAEETKKSTPATFKFFLSEIEVHIICTGLSATGAMENKTVLKNMYVFFNVSTFSLTGCKVEKPSGCTLKEPISLTAVEGTTNGVEEEKGEEPAIEFKPGEGTFGEMTFSGEKCGLKGMAAKIGGSLVGTAKGATVQFTAAHNTLIIGGKTITFTGAVTPRMHKEAGGQQNPISFTRTTP
jgi:hypothetical protein